MSEFLYLFIKLLGSLPLKFRRLLGKYFGQIAYYVSGREAEIARLHLSKILKISNETETARKVFQNLGINFMEDLNLDPILKDNSAVKVVTPEAFADYIKDEEPKITITAHIGNWDLLAGWLIKHARQKIITAAKPAKNPILHNLLIKIRDRYGISVIWRGPKSDRREILNAISPGSTMGVLIDQDTKVHSIQSKFMGLECKTPSRMIEFGLERKASYYAIFLPRCGFDKFELYCFKLTGHTPEDILKNYHIVLEDLIRKYPDQWVWMHKRWRTKLPGGTMSGSEYIKFLKNL